jgi:hypothetical protein
MLFWIYELILKNPEQKLKNTEHILKKSRTYFEKSGHILKHIRTIFKKGAQRKKGGKIHIFGHAVSQL